MPETVRVAVAIATPDGVWVVPRQGEDGEFAPSLLVGYADPTRDMEERERVALHLVHTRFHPWVTDSDLHPVAYFPVAEGDVDEVAVFCAFSDVAEPPIDPTLECIDAGEMPRLALGMRDPAVTIALLYAELHGRRGEPDTPFSPHVDPPAPDQSLALLHEEPTADGARWSATFSCEVTGEGKSMRGPQKVHADEALAWGREHADVVLLSTGERVGQPYNAGTQLDDDPETGEPWPPVPDLSGLAPRPIRPEHVTYLVPLNPLEPGTPEGPGLDTTR
ncbi:hypothetical protein [Patulibacter americanus]|uniref:hypothetical protein n=1 Tax=Patulibacter americanus TaxID=588672 RepID=UPI0003B37F39|nr:hypothetical protein [Patulibacter americanus]